MSRGSKVRHKFVSIGTKAAVWLCLLLFVAGAVIAVNFSQKTRERFVEGKLTAATMVADLFAASAAPALDFQDQEGLQQEVQKLGANPEIVYAAVFGVDGTAPAVEWARRPAEPHAEAPRASRTSVFPDHIDVARPLSVADGRKVGSLVLRVSLARENERFAEARRRIMTYAGIVTLLAAVAMLVVMHHLVARPLANLANGARGLELGRAEPVRVRANDEIGQVARAFNAMSEAIVDRERRLAELNRELMQLLDSMRQGILVFEKGGALAAVKSRQAGVLFGRTDLEGASVRELLYGSKDSVPAQAFEEWLAVAFDVPASAWPELDELAPKEVTIDRGEGERILSLDFRPITVDGRIERIMMLATDETEKRHLARTVEERSEEHEKQMAAMRRLVAGGGQLLVSVLDRARERIAACQAALKGTAGALDAPLVEQLFQHVHSVKGEARAFDLSALEHAAAELEDYLAILRGRLRDNQRISLVPFGAELEVRLAATRDAVGRAGEMLVEASPIGEAILQQVTVKREDVQALLEIAGARRDEVGVLVNRLASRPFGELLLGVGEAAQRWAVREGKRARIDVEGREVPIPRALARVLPDVLSHLVRNAVAHGIEIVADRVAAGKDEAGVIRVAAVSGPDGPTIVVEDDGRGLDATAVAERAKALGLRGDDAASLVFEAGLSTAKVSALAGHGVGLGAVRADLASIGYQLSLRSCDNGLAVTMTPPARSPVREMDSKNERTGVA